MSGAWRGGRWTDGDGLCHDVGALLPPMQRCPRRTLYDDGGPPDPGRPSGPSSRSDEASGSEGGCTVPAADLGAGPFPAGRIREPVSGRREFLQEEFQRARAKRLQIEAVIAYLEEELSR